MRTFALVLVLLAAVAPSASLAGRETSASGRSQTLEAALVQEINALRAERGVRRLTVSPALGRAAGSHSESMLERGFFAHESADGSPFAARLKRYYPARSGYWTVGENLAMAGPSEPQPGEIVSSWMRSPHHRANLLDPRWRELGVAARFAQSAQGAYGGTATWVVTLDLGSRRK
jgi:uncharacterized protein YkwD